MMKRYGLIGKSLTHSFSPTYFREKFKNERFTDCEYRNIELNFIGDIRKQIIQNPEISGLNVTIPYKESILPFLDEMDDTAHHVGSVNTIKIVSRNPLRLKGYNTDIVGFKDSLVPLRESHHQKALILGTGGASKAVQYVLRQLEIAYHLISRGPGKDLIRYSELTQEIIDQHQIIINTTPLGMYPNVDSAPEIPYHFICEKHLCYDLIYNPTKSVFLKKSEQQGATIKNGLEMLALQAEASWRIWNDKII